MVVLSMSCMSVLSSVWILSIHHQRGRPTKVPRWIHNFVLGCLAKCLFISVQSYRPKHKLDKLKLSSRSRVSVEDSEHVRISTKYCELFELQNNVDSTHLDNGSYRNSVIDKEENCRKVHDRNHSINRVNDSDEYLKRLIDLLERKDKSDEENAQCFNEWHDVALVLDRLCFVFFLTFTSLSTVCILAMKPGDHFIF